MLKLMPRDLRLKAAVKLQSDCIKQMHSKWTFLSFANIPQIFQDFVSVKSSLFFLYM